jgi:hypothetical protein
MRLSFAARARHGDSATDFKTLFQSLWDQPRVLGGPNQT